MSTKIMAYGEVVYATDPVRFQPVYGINGILITCIRHDIKPGDYYNAVMIHMRDLPRKHIDAFDEYWNTIIDTHCIYTVYNAVCKFSRSEFTVVDSHILHNGDVIFDGTKYTLNEDLSSKPTFNVACMLVLLLPSTVNADFGEIANLVGILNKGKESFEYIIETRIGDSIVGMEMLQSGGKDCIESLCLKYGRSFEDMIISSTAFVGRGKKWMDRFAQHVIKNEIKATVEILLKPENYRLYRDATVEEDILYIGGVPILTIGRESTVNKDFDVNVIIRIAYILYGNNNFQQFKQKFRTSIISDISVANRRKPVMIPKRDSDSDDDRPPVRSMKFNDPRRRNPRASNTGDDDEEELARPRANNTRDDDEDELYTARPMFIPDSSDEDKAASSGPSQRKGHSEVYRRRRSDDYVPRDLLDTDSD